MLKNLFIYMALLMLLPNTALAEAKMSMPNAHAYEFLSIDGDPIRISDFKGKVVLVVNTASQCGFTGQYEDLQLLHESYKDQGLVVLGVPSADFGGQEFPEEDQVKDFTHEKFAITFPLTQISNVKGEGAHPFYRWANAQAGPLGMPKWNFHKYLIDKNGDFVAGFGSMVSPIAPEIKMRVQAELEK